MRRRVLLGSVGLALVLAAAGCGGGGSKSSSGGTSASGGTPAGAAAVPADAPAFLTANLDFNSDAWKQLLTLARKFPSIETALKNEQDKLAKKGKSFGKDIQPVLGSEGDLAFLALKKQDFVIVLKPTDSSKLDSLFSTSGTPPARADVNGFTVLAPQQSSIDAAKNATSHLSDDQAFKDGIGALSGDDLIRFYGAGPAIQEALKARLAKGGTIPGTTTKLPTNLGGNTKLVWVSAGAAPATGGIRIDGAAKLDPAPKTQTYTPALPGDFASGALLYVSFAHLDGLLNQALNSSTNSSLNQQLAQAEAALGFSIKNDLIPLFAGEAGVAVYPGAAGSKRTFVFALKVSDEGKAKDVFGKIAKLVGGLGGGATTVNVPGVGEATEIKSSKSSIFFAVFNGKLVISNSTDGLKSVAGGGNQNLADDPLYKAAADGAGLSDTNGFLYVNLQDGASLFGSLLKSSSSGTSSTLKANAGALQSALFSIAQDGSIFRLRGFLGVK